MDGARQNFLGFTGDAKSKSVLAQWVADKGWSAESVRDGNADAAVEFLTNNPSPHVLCVDISSVQSAEATLDKLAGVCAPDVKVIVVGSVNEYSFFCWLMDMGISSYLLNPLTPETIQKAYEKAAQVPVASAPASAVLPDNSDTKMIAVVGMRGGVGATTISVNLASLFAHTFHKKTALLDLDPQLGTVALALDLEPTKGLRDVLEKPERMDSQFLDRVMITIDEELSILSAEEPLEENVHIAENAPSLLMQQIRSKFPYVVLDVPRQVTTLSRYALQHADYILCVVEFNLLSLREALRFQDYCRDHLKRSSPIFVANQVGMASKQQIPQEEFEKGLGQKVAFMVPYTTDVLDASIAGEAIVEDEKVRPVSRALYELAAHFVPNAPVLTIKNTWQTLQALFGKAK